MAIHAKGQNRNLSGKGAKKSLKSIIYLLYQMMKPSYSIQLTAVLFILSFTYMFTSKQKEGLRHYQSEGSLRKQAKSGSLQKKSKNLEEGWRVGVGVGVGLGSKRQKYGMSRFVTETNQKTGSKDQLLKYKQLFTSQSSGRIEQRREKHQQVLKNQSAKQFRKADINKAHSPLTSKLTKTEFTEYEPLAKATKRQKRPLKKERLRKEPHFHKASPPAHQIKSLFDDNREDKAKGAKGKASREKAGKGKGVSVESTPSCMLGEEVEVLELVDEGTFGKVFRGRLRKNGEMVAIKKVVQDSRYRNRELQIVSLLRDDFVVEILGSFMTREGGREFLNIMMGYYEENLFHRITLYRQSTINHLEAKIILYQLFKGLSYLHSLGIAHRDIKPENVLLRGSAAVLCDFGSAKLLRADDSNISYICARCYRAPELIFGATRYSTAIDVWSAGCVVLELLNGQPLFAGETSIAHLQQVMGVMGRPSEEEIHAMNPDFAASDYAFPAGKKTEWADIFPLADKALLDLVGRMMVYSPTRRASCPEVLAHEYFDELRDRLTYQHLRSQYRLKDFFRFSEQELTGHSHLRQRLVPQWYGKGE